MLLAFLPTNLVVILRNAFNYRENSVICFLVSWLFFGYSYQCLSFTEKQSLFTTKPHLLAFSGLSPSPKESKVV